MRKTHKDILKLMTRAALAAITLMQWQPLYAQSPSTGQKFEVVSIKLNKSAGRSRVNAIPTAGRLMITGMTVQDVIQGAYGLQSFQPVAVDSPVLKERIDIEAKTERPVGSLAQMQQMLQPVPPNSSAGGFPVSYMVDGVQYIAIPAGGGVNYRNLTPEIAQRSGGNTLFVFRLP